MEFLLLSCFFPETQDNRAAAIWNLAGNCDKDEKRTWGTVHSLFKFISRKA